MNEVYLYKAIIQRALVDLKLKTQKADALEYFNSELFIDHCLNAEFDLAEIRRQVEHETRVVR